MVCDAHKKTLVLTLQCFNSVNLFSPWQLSPGHSNYLDFLLSVNDII